MTTARLFSPKLLQPFKIPTGICKSLSVSASLLTLVIVRLSGFSHLSECGVVSHCDYDSLPFIQLGFSVNFV